MKTTYHYTLESLYKAISLFNRLAPKDRKQFACAWLPHPNQDDAEGEKLCWHLSFKAVE